MPSSARSAGDSGHIAHLARVFDAGGAGKRHRLPRRQLEARRLRPPVGTIARQQIGIELDRAHGGSCCCASLGSAVLSRIRMHATTAPRPTGAGENRRHLLRQFVRGPWRSAAAPWAWLRGQPVDLAVRVGHRGTAAIHTPTNGSLWVRLSIWITGLRAWLGWLHAGLRDTDVTASTSAPRRAMDTAIKATR